MTGGHGGGRPTVIVVPCYDEAARLDPAALAELARLADARIVLVDDGSTDGTPALLAAIVAADPQRFELVTSPTNVGKGEAVRLGLLAARRRGAVLLGYFDADLATPPAEMARLVSILRDGADLDVVLGSRVGLLGHRVRRSMRRHYLGRLFATASSLVLRLDVYDTQCGAKVFRDGPAFEAAVARPFTSRWVFDVELIGRLRRGAGPGTGLAEERFLEVPLFDWCDRSGSKLAAGAALGAMVDLVRVARALRAWPR